MILISVIIPFHKDLQKLYDAVTSVCNQCIDKRVISFEIIIGNDSNISISELQLSIAPLIPSYYTFLVVDNKYKRGPGGNRNTAIEASSGTYIAFLDSDDTWEPMKTYFQYCLIRKGVNFIASSYIYSEDDTDILPPKQLSGFKSILFSWRPLGTSTIVVSKSILPSNPFPSLWFCQDLVLWSKLLTNPNCCYGSVAIPLVRYSKNSGRTSKSSVFELLSAFYLACNVSSLNQLESLVASLQYLVRAFINKIIRPRLKKLDCLCDSLIKHFGLLLFPSKLFYFITQSLFFDLLHNSKTCQRRRFAPGYSALNLDEITYVAVHNDIFNEALSRSYEFIEDIGSTPESYQFIDLSVRNGKSLMLMCLNFKNKLRRFPALGVDPSATLIDYAYANIRAVSSDNFFKLFQADVSQSFSLVDSNNVILYANNPFGPDVLKGVIESYNKTVQIIIIYVEPVHSNVLYDYGFICVFHRKKLFYETRSREYSLFFRPGAMV